MARQQGGDVVFAGGVETAVALGDVLTQQAIAADDFFQAFGIFRRQLAVLARHQCMIEHQQVIADFVETVGVALAGAGFGVGDRRHFLVEDAVADGLRGIDLTRRGGETDFEIAAAAIACRRIRRAHSRRCKRPAAFVRFYRWHYCGP